ncbi:FRG domain-containing protein [Priestia filamentosa]|uniref:FRG domain-containing protein n=1 Tax=Priestia filamentosa TaxID=1402861 RepID=UPI003982822A
MSIEARNLKEIKEYINEFSTKINREGMWFRGVNNAAFDLVPGLQRSLPKQTFHQQTKEIEKEMFNIFKSAEELQDKNLTDWEILYLMQHSGLKTRFLDWSLSPKVSLFFATYNWNEEQNARLWLLDPHLLNEVFWGEYTIISPQKGKTYFDFLDSVISSNDIYAFDAFRMDYPYPYSNINKRINAQKGVFTFHLSSNVFGSTYGDSLNAQLSNVIKFKKIPFSHEKKLRSSFPSSDIVLDYIDILPGAKEEIKEYLVKQGITIKTLFPDLPGIVDYINDSFQDIINQSQPSYPLDF